jgi:hypothetical protein
MFAYIDYSEPKYSSARSKRCAKRAVTMLRGVSAGFICYDGRHVPHHVGMGARIGDNMVRVRSRASHSPAVSCFATSKENGAEPPM